MAEKLTIDEIHNVAASAGIELTNEDAAYISTQFDGFSILFEDTPNIPCVAEIMYDAQRVREQSPPRMRVRELVNALRCGEGSATRVVSDCYERLEAKKSLNNFISVNRECIRDAEKLASSENVGELFGVPIAVKDNIDAAGLSTTCASRLFCDKRAAETDADCVARIIAAGGVIMGKTNMDELAMGSTNESSAFGAVKNAVDASRVPGGSSGGSANAVAAKQALCALGTDTGGSIRQPAAYCGVVGLKPTFGAVSTKGLNGFVPSLDTIGVLAPDCDSAGIVFGAMSGREMLRVNSDIEGMTIGIPAECMARGKASAKVRDQLDKVLFFLSDRGVNTVKIRLPSFPKALAAYHVLSSTEAAENILRSVEKSKLGCVGREVRRRIVAGIIAAGRGELVERARAVRDRLRREYAEAFIRCDAILSPTAPTMATFHGKLNDPNKSHYGDYFLAPVSLAGLPAVSVPFGKTFLPVGLQIIGNYGCEQRVLDVGSCLEYKRSKYD